MEIEKSEKVADSVESVAMISIPYSEFKNLTEAARKYEKEFEEDEIRILKQMFKYMLSKRLNEYGDLKEFIRANTSYTFEIKEDVVKNKFEIIFTKKDGSRDKSKV